MARRTRCPFWPALAVALIVAAAAAGRPAAARDPRCAPASTRSAAQLVTVEASGSGTTYASLRLWGRSGRCWVAVAGPWTARLGRNGLSGHHREGDGTTPTGVYSLGPVIYGVAPDPGVRYAYHRLVCGDWWDEDPASPTYNTFQHVRCGARPPFAGASEALWRATVAYRHFAVIQYNTGPAVPGRGSAIFLHVDTGRATNGCVSLPPTALDTVLRWLRPDARPLIVVGTRAELARFPGR